MRPILSFDIEVWCNGWTRLDEDFPRAFERYVYGHSRTEPRALPKTLEILRRHGLRAVFFVEPLFAARFGVDHLRRIVDLIGSHDQQIELHLHSEWADEIRPRPLPHVHDKRQHLQQLPFEDQFTLIKAGLALLREAGAPRIGAFRAGSFGANADTLRAVAAAGLDVDSSINAASELSVPDLRGSVDLFQPSRIGGLLSLPLTVFRDGFGRLRPAQVGSCSFSELRQLIDTGIHESWPAMVMLSHNFEMLRQDSVKTDPIVLARFERLCAYIARNPGLRSTKGNLFDGISPPSSTLPVPRTSFSGTARRFAEQILRRALPA
jgi:hypothetical protein